MLDERQAFLEQQAGDLAQRRRKAVLARPGLDLLGDGELLVARRRDVRDACARNSAVLYAITLTLL